MKKNGIVFLVFVILVTGVELLQLNTQGSEMSLIPESQNDVPLFEGLKQNGSSKYVMSGNYWEDILGFYKNVLPEKGWEPDFIQLHKDSTRDDTGFISRWKKVGEKSGLWLSGGYYQNRMQTEIIVDYDESVSNSSWILGVPTQISIYEQPQRTDEYYTITDQESIYTIASMVNRANVWKHGHPPLYEKSIMKVGEEVIDVYYDLNEGIYLVSDQGTKYMQPDVEFFQLTRISKEY